MAHLEATVEQYFIKPTRFCPSNDLPLLIYRSVLPSPLTEESTSEFLQRHQWEKRGSWGTIINKHFHPNSHECYGIWQGSSEMVFGETKADEPGSGILCRVSAGDVVVIPAGVAHASVAEMVNSPAEEDPSTRFRYIGVYPKGSDRWRNEYGKRELLEDDELIKEAAQTAIPMTDPVKGADGPLVNLWTNARGEEKRMTVP